MKHIELPFKLKRPMLACGADIKGAFAIAWGREAFLYGGFGDLGDIDNLDRYEKAVRRAESDLSIRPKVIVCDLHPGYFSTNFAESLQSKAYGCKLFKAQHHEAHIASTMVDNRIRGDAIGVAFDGTGFGPDGNIWGGEFFIGNAKDFRRLAHLEYLPMPGAERTIAEPWRMALSYLYSAFGNNFLKTFSKRRQAPFIKQMIDNGINSPLTSSAGRLFDAVGSIVLGKREAKFEAELPIKLEAIADTSCGLSYSFGVKRSDGVLILDPRNMIKGIIRDMDRKVKSSRISAKFHNTVAAMILETVSSLHGKFGTKKVVLSGGVFQNKFLLKRAIGLLKKKGYEVFTHQQVSTNDSGIPIGQIAIANARTQCV